MRTTVPAHTTTNSDARASEITFSNLARSIAAGVAALGLSHPTPAEAHAEAAPTTPITERTQTPRAATYDLMRAPVSIEMQSGTLEQVLAHLSHLSRIPIEVLWASPRFPNGLSRDTELSFAATNLPLAAALDRLATQLSGADDSITWQVLEDGRLQFGIKESLNRFQERKIYRIDDLAFNHPQFANAPEFDLNGALQQGRGGGGGSIIGDPKDDTPRALPSDGQMTLQELITNTIEQEQWRVNGGSAGFIQTFQSSLIITAPPYIHRQLG